MSTITQDQRRITATLTVIIGHGYLLIWLQPVWSPPTTSGLETERVYSGRSRQISQEVNK